MIESLTPLIQARNFPPILFMFGEEEFLLEEAYNALIEAAVDNTNPMASFNFEVFDGTDITVESLVEMASAFPMMAERRVVVVKHFEKMSIKAGAARGATKTSKSKTQAKTTDGETEKKAIQSAFARYVANPSPTTLLVLVADVPELAGLRSALGNPKQQEKAQKKLAAAKFPYNILLEQSEWIEFPKLYERELASWVARRFKSFGRDITHDACELLVAQSGESLRDLHNEIQKILTYVQNKQKITHDDIVTLIGASKTFNIFELQKAVGLRRMAAAIEIMRRMLAVDRQELLIITMLTRYFTILWKLSESVRITRNQFELGKAVAISPFFIPEYLAALELYPQALIERALYALCDADIAIKTSAESPDIALQKMLTKVIG